MSVHSITIEGSSSVRLPVAGKYCDRDIVVTAVSEGVDLPELTNPATAGDLMAGKQMINGEGEAVDGTFTLETEMTEQDSLIEQIKEALKGKAAGGGSGCSGGVVVCEDAEVTKTTTLEKLQGVRLSLPNAESIGSEAFLDCTALTSVNLPVAESVGEAAFYGCTNLTSIDLPAATSIGNGAFMNCAALTSIDLPVAESIGDGAFLGCTNLSALILPNTETVCQLIFTAVLGTKIVTAEVEPTGEGFIYVPTALYEDYVAYFVMHLTVDLGADEATATYLATAILRKKEDYPEICG